jgi:hypothetical protein
MDSYVHLQGIGTYGTQGNPCLPKHWYVTVRAKQQKRRARIWAKNKQPIKFACRSGTVTLTQYQTNRVQPAGTWVLRTEARWNPYLADVGTRHLLNTPLEIVLGIMPANEVVEYASGVLNAAVQLGEWRLI